MKKLVLSVATVDGKIYHSKPQPADEHSRYHFTQLIRRTFSFGEYMEFEEKESHGVTMYFNTANIKYLSITEIEESD